MKVEHLFSYIINNNNLIIYGGSWTIALEDGTKIVSDNNPNFGQYKDITSYQTEIYASLVASLFIYFYSQFYMIDFTNQCTTVYFNKKYV